MWRETPLEVVCNNHSPAPIYGGYLPRTDAYCGVCCAPGTVSICCTWHMCWLYVCVVVLGAHLVLSVLTALGICVCYMWSLECTHVLAICGAWSAPMCWLYVELGVHLCVGYMWCLECTYVLVYVELGVHLCVGYMWSLECTYVLAICGA